MEEDGGWLTREGRVVDREDELVVVQRQPAPQVSLQASIRVAM